MSLQKSFIYIVLLFLAYSFHAYAIPIDQVSPEKCENLSSLDFEITITKAQEELVEVDDWPIIEEEGLRFQEDNILVITMTTLNPATGIKEQSQILDDTGFFAAYLSGMQLMRKFHRGEFITDKDVDLLNQYLDRFEESVDDTLWTDLRSENHLEQTLNRDDLHEKLNQMLNFAHADHETQGLVIRSYVRTKTGKNSWSTWNSYKGLEYWNLHGEGHSITDQFFEEQVKVSENRHICTQFIQMDFQVIPIIEEPRKGVLESKGVQGLLRDKDSRVISIPQNGSRGINVLATVWREEKL